MSNLDEFIYHNAWMKYYGNLIFPHCSPEMYTLPSVHSVLYTSPGCIWWPLKNRWYGFSFRHDFVFLTQGYFVISHFNLLSYVHTTWGGLKIDCFKCLYRTQNPQLLLKIQLWHDYDYQNPGFGHDYVLCSIFKGKNWYCFWRNHYLYFINV